TRFGAWPSRARSSSIAWDTRRSSWRTPSREPIDGALPRPRARVRAGPRGAAWEGERGGGRAGSPHAARHPWAALPCPRSGPPDAPRRHPRDARSRDRPELLAGRPRAPRDGLPAPWLPHRRPGTAPRTRADLRGGGRRIL